LRKIHIEVNLKAMPLPTRAPKSKQTGGKLQAGIQKMHGNYKKKLH